jgi:hypothetical protein
MVLCFYDYYRTGTNRFFKKLIVKKLNWNFGNLTLAATFVRFCYRTVDFTKAASQNGVCIKQGICHKKYLVSQLLFAKRLK